jgi:hypothetical protein
LALFLLTLPSVVLLLAFLSLWIGREGWRRRIGRPLGYAAALLAGLYAALAAAIWVLTLGEALRSIRTFEFSFQIPLLAALHGVFLASARRAARRGSVGGLGILGALLGLLVALLIAGGMTMSMRRVRQTASELTGPPDQLRSRVPLASQWR